MESLSPPEGRACIHVLGDLRIRNASGHRVDSLEAQPKRAALLIYLACLPADNCITRDQLLALFWPDFDDERARNSLRTSLYYVRRSIGPGIVQSRPDGSLAADPHVLWCDVRVFETAIREGRWREAADLYRGDFLEGGGPSVSIEYDQWVEATRRRLRRQCSEALYRIADASELAGEPEAALDALARARLLLPADESVLRRMLTLLGRLGNRVRAIQEYEAFAGVLAESYELEPSQETREILERVTAAGTGSASPAPPSRPRAAGPPDASPHEPQPVPTSPRARRTLSRRRLSAALAVVLVPASLFLGRAWAADRPVARAEKVIVLPFELSGRAELASLADALAPLLSDELRALGAEVLEARSLEGGGSRWEDQVERARGLGASVVVTGRVIALDDSVAALATMVPISGPPVPRSWARSTGSPSDLGPITAVLARGLSGPGR